MFCFTTCPPHNTHFHLIVSLVVSPLMNTYRLVRARRNTTKYYTETNTYPLFTCACGWRFSKQAKSLTLTSNTHAHTRARTHVRTHIYAHTHICNDEFRSRSLTLHNNANDKQLHKSVKRISQLCRLLPFSVFLITKKTADIINNYSPYPAIYGVM